LEAWAESRAAPFTNLILPNIFGEGGRAYYNSVVATFCQQLTTGSEPTVEDDREIELLHAQAAASAVLACMREQRLGDQRVKGQPIGVSQLLAKLREMLGSYRADILPDLQTGFELDLFNTLRYYLFPTHYPVRVVRRQDARGALFEVIKTMNGGQCFFSTTQPGVTRGNHYHRRKIERFMVVSGKARIRIRRLHCSDVTEFDVSGDLPEYVDIPTLHTHSITNVGSSELMTLFWANEIFDSQHPDTVAEKVRE
jgi:UDP-2-acetamido-2,6-beta-L-arabino-hexul-4-ose reductase